MKHSGMPFLNYSMLKNPHNIRFTVFEHQALFTHKGEQRLPNELLSTLQTFYKEKDFPYYSLIHKGIRFCEYVGVIQIGGIVIEVLPKADNNGKEYWRKMLIDMLRAVGSLPIKTPTNSDLHLKNNSILDLYIEQFVIEAEILLHKGLIKCYKKVEGNSYALKGSIRFARHIQRNLTHEERFYVRYTIYNKEHPFNCVLYKTLKVIERMNTTHAFQSRLSALLLNFPEMPDIRTDESFFSRLQYNRRSEPYKKVIEIARLILLNYHPDVKKGRNEVLALMFDMNKLWEQFIYVSLKKNNPQRFSISAQSHRNFWKKEEGRSKRMIADIVIERSENDWVVLDTKWKNLGKSNPSDTDLRQMYAYSKFHQNAQTALVYPGTELYYATGSFYNELDNDHSFGNNCGVLMIPVGNDIKTWQKEIADTVFNRRYF